MKTATSAMKPRPTSINPRQSIQKPGSRDRRPFSDRVKRSVGRDITKKQKEPSEKKKQMAHAREKKKKQMAHAREQKQKSNKNCLQEEGSSSAAAEGSCARAEGSSAAFDIATAALANAVAAAKIESNAAEI